MGSRNFKLFKNPPRPGPRHPFAQALMLLGALVDQRLELELHGLSDDGHTFVFTAGGYIVEVFFDGSGTEFDYVSQIITPAGDAVSLCVREEPLENVFKPLVYHYWLSHPESERPYGWENLGSTNETVPAS